MIHIIKRYRLFLIAVLGMFFLNLVDPSIVGKALDITSFSVREMLLVIPPIFILLGLLDVWVPKETMSKFMGEDSGVRGILLAFLIGSAAAGPLYGAFPVAAVFMKKGVKFSNILIFIGAWSTTKIPMFLFEMTALGARFAITRLLVNIPVILLTSIIISKLMEKDEIQDIYKNAEFNL